MGRSYIHPQPLCAQDVGRFWTVYWQLAITIFITITIIYNYIIYTHNYNHNYCWPILLLLFGTIQFDLNSQSLSLTQFHVFHFNSCIHSIRHSVIDLCVYLNSCSFTLLCSFTFISFTLNIQLIFIRHSHNFFNQNKLNLRFSKVTGKYHFALNSQNAWT